jgi:hypothetical protein
VAALAIISSEHKNNFERNQFTVLLPSNSGTRSGANTAEATGSLCRANCYFTEVSDRCHAKSGQKKRRAGDPARLNGNCE